MPGNELCPLCGAYKAAHCINLFLNVEGYCSLEGLFLHPKVTVFLFVTSEYHVGKNTSRLKIL